jgi:DNA-binding transcriptional MerR regulator
LSRLYRVHEFAGLAGVTSKTLHHYDRVGLLKPGRTDAGYRLYTERDFERLEQIIALKFLGLPLKRIKAVLDRTALELPDALRQQRSVLEEKQQLLARAIRAIREAENAIEPGKPADPAILKRIIEAIDMQDGIDEMKRFYRNVNEEAWSKLRQRYEQWPSEEWKDLYGDVRAALGEDFGGERAQALARRWMELVESETGSDPTVRAGMMQAWRARQYWPRTLQQRISEYHLEEVWEFIEQAIVRYRKNRYSGETWAEMAGLTRRADDPVGSAWHDLFLEIDAALGEDAASHKAQSLAARWWEMDPSRERTQVLVARYQELAGQSTHWPDRIARQAVLFSHEKLAGFIAKASYVRMMKCDSLYRDVEASLGEDPSGEKAQAIAARWAELAERGAGGANIRAGLVNACPTLQHHIAFEKVADFLGKAAGGSR